MTIIHSIFSTREAYDNFLNLRELHYIIIQEDLEISKVILDDIYQYMGIKETSEVLW